MSTNTLNRDQNSGTNLRSVGQYRFTQEGRTYVWEHTDTGLTVELTKVAGQYDGYGNIDKGYRGFARSSRNEPAVDEICGRGEAAYLPSKAEAWAKVREWMKNRPDGELLGDEEVEF